MIDTPICRSDMSVASPFIKIGPGAFPTDLDSVRDLAGRDKILRSRALALADARDFGGER